MHANPTIKKKEKETRVNKSYPDTNLMTVIFPHLDANFRRVTLLEIFLSAKVNRQQLNNMMIYYLIVSRNRAISICLFIYKKKKNCDHTYAATTKFFFFSTLSHITQSARQRKVDETTLSVKFSHNTHFGNKFIISNERKTTTTTTKLIMKDIVIKFVMPFDHMLSKTIHANIRLKYK